MSTEESWMDEPQLLKVPEYAKHLGVSKAIVYQAIAAGRLKEAVSTGADGIKRVDVAVGDREWAANTDLSKAPPEVKERGAKLKKSVAAQMLERDAGGGAPDVATSSEEEKRWKAKLAELKFREAAGELVLASAVKNEWAKLVIAFRAKALALPSRVKQEIPALSIDEIEKLEELVREVLEDLAENRE